MSGLAEKELEELKQKIKAEFSGYKELAGGKNFRYHHLLSVHKYVQKIVEMEGIEQDVDLKVLETAALFHDIGRVEDIEDGYLDPIAEHEGHDERGAEIVSRFLGDVLDEEQIRKVEDLIRNHHSNPESLEGKVLQDADHLFKYGIQNIWRTFHYGYEKDRNLKESIEYFLKTGGKKMEERLEEFHLDPVREVGEERLQEQEEAYKKMEKNLDGGDITD